VLTSEIGDTWIHGVASGSFKTCQVSRSRAAETGLGIAQGKFAVGDLPTLLYWRHLFWRSSTPGAPTLNLVDFDHYTPGDLAPMLDTKTTRSFEFSWQEKRQDLFDGICHLPLPLREQAQTRGQSSNRFRLRSRAVIKWEKK